MDNFIKYKVSKIYGEKLNYSPYITSNMFTTLSVH